MGKQLGRAAGLVAWAASLGVLLLLAFAFLPTLFGFETLLVASGSMGRTMPVGSAALTRAVEARAISIGDVISFRQQGDGETTTHRVVGIEAQPGQVVFTTKGDANDTADPQPVVVGGRIHRLEHVVPYAGLIVRYARSPMGGVLLFIVPIAGLMIDRRARSSRTRRRGRLETGDIGWSTTTFSLVGAAPRVLGSGPGG